MLKLYNKEHVAIGALTNLKDYKIEYLLSGEDLLECSLSIADENIHLVEEEGYVRNKFNEYVIKAIDPSENFKRYSCVVNIEDIKAKSIKSFDTSNNNITDTIRLAIAGTGWILADNNITKRRTVRLKNTNALEVLREIRKVFRVDFRFDAINKIIYVYEQFGSDKGVYFSDELNLRVLNIPSDTYDYATRLYPYGKDGLNISSINGGKEYIDNFQYSNKIIELIWEDNRYTDISSLKADAEAKLEELSKPKRSYQTEVSDLAKQNKEYEFLDFFLGDTITLLSKQEKFRDKQRIVKYIEYPNESYKNTCELGNTTLTFEDLQKENEAKNQVVDNITSDNGTVSEGAIPDIGSDKIYDFEASVVKIVDLTAINIKVSNLEAQNVTITGKLTAIESEFGTIKANVGVIDKLTVTHTAQINALEANKASITQLEAVSAIIGIVEADVAKIQTLVNGNLSSENIQAGGITSDKLTIANGFITNAMIASLDVNKVNAGDISTNKFRIISDSGNMLIADNTIQIRDNTRVRVQIGKDASNDYNMYVWDSNGKLMFDATGLKADGIKNKIIRDDMISDNANIGGSKINISSLITEVNKDTNTSTIKSSKVNIDLLNQTLDIAFNSLKTQADDTKTLTESHSTIISTMQGQITTAINNTKIEKDGQTILLKDDYNRTVQTVNSMNSTIGSHTTSINEHTGKITGVETRVNTVERNLDSITQRVSSTESNVSTIKTTANNALSNSNSALDKLSINQQTKMNGIEYIDQSYYTILGRIPFTNGKVTQVSLGEGTRYMLSTSGSQVLKSDYIPFTPDMPLYTQVSVYNEDTTNGIFYLGIEFYDENKVSLGANDLCIYTIQASSSNLPINTWKTFENYLGVSSFDATRKGATYIRLRILTRWSGNTGTTYLKDIHLKQLGSTIVTELSTTNNRVSSIETNLNSITSRVSTVETKQTTTDGKVTALETWKKEAEVKITDASIISTVSSQFYKKGETDSKYATQSSVSTLTQTVNGFEFSITQTGANNIIYNSKWINKLNFWAVSSDTETHYYDMWFAEKGTGIGIKPKTISTKARIVSDFFDISQDTDYTLSIAYQVDANSNGISLYLEQFDENNTYITGNPIVVKDKISFQQGVSFFIKTSSDTRVKRAKIVIGNDGVTSLSNCTLWLAWIKLSKGKIDSKWSPNPNELYNNIVKLDNEGIKIEHANNSFTRINNRELYQANENGDRTLSMRLGGLRFYKWSEDMSYLGGVTSSRKINDPSKYGISFFGTANSEYIDLSMADYTEDGQTQNISPFLSLIRSENLIRLNRLLDANNCDMNNVNTLRTKYAYGNIFGSDTSGRLVIGGGALSLGVAEGSGITNTILIADKVNTHSWTHWNFNGYTMLNCNISTTLSPQSQYLKSMTKAINDVYGTYTTDPNEIRCKGKGEITCIGELVVEIPLIIAENIQLDYQVHISKYGLGDYYIKERNQYYFVIEADREFTFDWEIVATKLEKPTAFSIIANEQYKSNNENDYQGDNPNMKNEISSKFGLLEDNEIELLPIEPI